jgi:hypothetical protein
LLLAHSTRWAGIATGLCLHSATRGGIIGAHSTELRRVTCSGSQASRTLGPPGTGTVRLASSAPFGRAGVLDGVGNVCRTIDAL